MCTAISKVAGDHYFGRNLDLPYHYEESVTVMPRNFPLAFRCVPSLPTHYGMIGIATVDKGYPLYYDGVNEFGLCMAALNFPGNGFYLPAEKSQVCVGSFELIPWVLSQYKNTRQAIEKLQNVRITDIAYSPEYPPTPLHWILADRQGAYVLEPLADGLRIYENPVGVLTNNPPFPWQLAHLRQYIHLTGQEPNNKTLTDSNGTGWVGLPGDPTSPSRFVRAALFTQWANWHREEPENVAQFFQLLRSVQQIEGTIRHQGQMDKTVYSACCNASRGIYYYTTYENSQLTAVVLGKEDVDGNSLRCYPLKHKMECRWEN